VDYQHWLDMYASELTQAHPGVALDDVDPLYLQSLFYKDLGPSEAASLGIVYRDQLKDEGSSFSVSNLLDRIHWDLALGAVGVLLFFALLIGPRMVAHFGGPDTVDGSASQGGATGQGDFFASGEVNTSTQSGNLPTRTPSSKPSLAQNPGPLPAGLGYGGPNPRALSPLHHGVVRRSGVAPVQYTASPRNSGATQRSPAGGGMVSTSAAGPTIEQFDVTTTSSGDQGLTGSVSWRVVNADSVQLLLLGIPISGETELIGSMPFDTLAAGSVFTLRASGGGHVVEQSETAEAN